jgi:hypothetical protein
MDLTEKEKNIIIQLIRSQLDETNIVLDYVSNGKFDISIINDCKQQIDNYLIIIDKLKIN